MNPDENSTPTQDPDKIPSPGIQPPIPAPGPVAPEAPVAPNPETPLQSVKPASVAPAPVPTPATTEPVTPNYFGASLQEPTVDVAQQQPQGGGNRQKIIALLIATVVVVTGLGTALWLVMRQPDKADYSYIKDTAMKELSDAEQKLVPTVNAYLASYKTAYNNSGVADEAEDKARQDYDAFKRAEEEVRTAVDKLLKSKAANDRETKQAIAQLATASIARADYFASLADSYPQFEDIFGGKDNKVCNDLFLGQTTSFADRKERLSKAAADCYTALDTLKKSANPTYRDFAFKIEKRVKQLEHDVTKVAETEKKYQEFLAKEAEFKQRFADAEKRNASDAELDKLADEINAVNVQIRDNNANLDYYAKRYTATVKEIPTMLEAVYGTDVKQKLTYHESLTNTREKTLRAVIDDKVLRKS